VTSMCLETTALDEVAKRGLDTASQRIWCRADTGGRVCVWEDQADLEAASRGILKAPLNHGQQKRSHDGDQEMTAPRNH
jgi:hypothetical protein